MAERVAKNESDDRGIDGQAAKIENKGVLCEVTIQVSLCELLGEVVTQIFFCLSLCEKPAMANLLEMAECRSE